VRVARGDDGVAQQFARMSVIGMVLTLILVFDVGSIPLLVFGHGAPVVGTVRESAPDHRRRRREHDVARAPRHGRRLVVPAREWR
jgi:hypothetical protein